MAAADGGWRLSAPAVYMGVKLQKSYRNLRKETVVFFNNNKFFINMDRAAVEI